MLLLPELRPLQDRNQAPPLYYLAYVVIQSVIQVEYADRQLAAALLVVLQFTPAIRQKLRLLHRINGYIVVLLSLIANVGAIMIAREAFGGTLATQSWIGATFILTTVGLGLAIYNVKMLQIDQHRAWMLRTWFYVCHIPHNTLLHAALSLTSNTVLLNHHPPHHHDNLRANRLRRRRLLVRPKLRQAP
jgi:uncharacterized membrane protein